MKRKLLCGMILTMAASMLTGFTMTASAEEERWNNTIARDEDGNIAVTFPDMIVTIPSDWAGKCQMGTSEDEVAFYQTKSRQLYTEEFGYANGGWLFSICFSETPTFADYYPNFEVIAQVSDGYYFVSLPTDVQGYLEDDEAMAEYTDMFSDVDWITANIEMTCEDAFWLDNITVYSDAIDIYSEEDYIFPQSSTEYMTKADLAGMTADEVQMAINEIYARHHRKFILPEVQDYFDSKSWYTGTIEAASFDVSVMSQLEWANIEVMLDYMENGAADSSVNIVIESSASNNCYGMIIEKGSGYFIVRQQDGTSIQFWYDKAKLGDMGIVESELTVGETVSLMYTDSFEAVNILVF